MFNQILNGCSILTKCARFFSLHNHLLNKYCCKVLIVGGGAGGCSLGSKLSRVLKKTELIILEPSENHYYQGWLTLCGAGIKQVCDTIKPMAETLPKNALWIQNKAAELDPENNTVVTCEGDKIEYDILVLAAGMVMCWNKIPGLLDALENYENVGTIFSPKYAEKTYRALGKFKRGNAIFTYPDSFLKCAGAPLKICFLIEDLLRLRGIRHQAEVFYHTPRPILYRVPHYEKTLYDIAEKRDINIELNSKLVEIRPGNNEVVFKHMKTNKQRIQKYAILHATPPMQTPDALRNCQSVVNKDGFVEVDKHTMQHVRYPNIFSIGDCCSAPNSKTAAACAAQTPVVFNNICSVLEGKECESKYDGYASCPIVTAIGKCLMAEFDYNNKPKETFPFSQNRELWIMYFMKKELLPLLYWNLMMKGYWNGPSIMRKLFHLGFSD